MNRRTFLQQAAVALAAGNLAPGVAAAQQRSLQRIGLQLYTLRAQMARDVEATLARVAAMGFSEVEFAGYYDTPPVEIKAMLSRHGLAAPATHTLIRPLERELDRLIEECKTIGHRYLVMAYLLPGERTLEDYKKHIEVLNRAGERCREAGIRLAYHNHDFEFQKQGEGDVVPFDLLLEGVAPELMAIELDLFWIYKAGADPFAYFRRAPSRFELLHVKDLSASTGSFTEVGSGTVPFAKVFAQNEGSGAQHFFVEQDVIAGDPYESLEQSLGFLQRLRF